MPLTVWKDISVDYIIPLPDSLQGTKTYKYIIVVVDRLTKMKYYIPIISMNTDKMAYQFIARIYCLYGLPDTIVLDRGSQFVLAFWKALSTTLGTTLKPSSGYYPETNR